jgi:hypothetical protein
MVPFYEGLGEELSLYVRQLAWLMAVPKDPKQKNLASDPKEPVSRFEQMKEDGFEPELPPVSAPHLITWLMEIGPVELAGMDRVPISWREIHYWKENAAVDLRPGEARLLRRLSSDYLAESRQAEKPDCPAPYGAPGTAVNVEVVDRKIRSFFSAFMRPRG